jgi:hypothetical protein
MTLDHTCATKLNGLLKKKIKIKQHTRFRHLGKWMAFVVEIQRELSICLLIYHILANQRGMKRKSPFQ